ncbi:putative DEAH [Coccomyxa subellipsoidea C-169]|uniref:RNA helicase n=1 Tax=Coccomyxa subellipsoidea (strain C-169) TaxID=574566 RepID=I0YP88_COCSC|nr:putative DEAH [Coccomyxa subellipsoidea C-169]EIE20207.1 putative DEAH [Coccomyxa subellipsoidea C-169]|eukprot:XP_005644751.1 putative DEAH [Coccomyxa subellipsoidea C-169]
MGAFLRPGERQPGAFGISFDSDRDKNAAVVPTFNRNEKLALQEQRRRLPVFQHRREILYLVEHHATVIIVGETGSGKTTQIPQYLLEAGWCSHGRMVACTQPRRVAAMTVAARVAEETGSPLGQAVGYGIRFEDVSTPGTTQIRFCTDGVLLQEMLQDPLLTAYSVIMVDEAHERSLATDTLLGLLKKVQRRRPDLRVIVASATLEAERVAAFFDASTVRGAAAKAGDLSKQPAILSVEGRTHSVQIHYLEKPCSDYVRAAVQAAADIHREDMPGDILIFLTGQQECEDCVSMLEEEARKVRAGRAALRLMPVPLYAGLPAAAQLAAFEHSPRGYRKVVVATNIAETSVTIDGVVYVIDCCHSKQASYNPLTGLESLLVAPVSKASASQRAGRAGRMRPGHCFRLCTEADFQALHDATVPEMQRAELSGTVLRLKALGVDNMMTFDWLAPPPAETMVRALELLHALGALDASARLSRPTGQQLAELPVDARLGAVLLASVRLGCSEEAVTVVAMLSVHSVWAGAHGERKALEAAKAKFAVGEGDLVTYLNVWKAWQDSGRDRKWAARNFVNHRTLLRAADIRSQLCHHLRRLRIALESCDAEVSLLRKALTAGLLMNAVQLVDTANDISDPASAGINVYRILRSTGPGPPPKLRIHASSVLARTRPQWLVFWQMQQSSSGWFEMQEVTAVEPHWLPELAAHVYSHKGIRS